MLQLRYFASLREIVGIDSEEIDLPDNVSDIASLVSWLRTRNNIWNDALGDHQLHVAINHEIARFDSAVSDGDEIAWYPPVTGG